MVVRTFLTVLLCFIAFSVVQNTTPEKSSGATIRALESQWTDAYKQRQSAALAALMADDYVITTEDGTTYSKVGFISYNMGPLRVDTVEMADLKIRFHENVAVVTANYHESGESNGTPYDYRDKITDVWMKLGGKWQLIASHRSLPSKS